MKNECDTVKKKLEEVIALNRQMQKENKRLEQSCINTTQSKKGENEEKRPKKPSH